MSSLTAIGGMVLSFGVLAFIFWPLEKAWAARPGQPLLRSGFRTDLAYFVAQYLVLAPLALVVLNGVKTLCQVEALTGLQVTVARQPWWLQAIEAVVLCDVLVYGFHRLSHQVDFLWRFHAVHHSAEHLDWLAAHREHPVDGLLTQLVVNLPAMLMGFPLTTLAMLIAFRGMWAIFIHSNVRLPLGPLGFSARPNCTTGTTRASGRRGITSATSRPGRTGSSAPTTGPPAPRSIRSGSWGRIPGASSRSCSRQRRGRRAAWHVPRKGPSK
ncbi:sterol desaturase family protein [Corallococcus macrosporus]|uniref:Fatty acid hydroxylase domain-containing protein n=1 Tax=Myxococcus fulvus (strain ATCC BAA-855 / HW-1) TaxID=483219 RepID=F8CHG7_MYXFH|nr:sterol desaturase family protein [Corallococcus macrosporus]AEI66285.1 hypothetical protein LILAB_21930 [Corallococcus macrosporus]